MLGKIRNAIGRGQTNASEVAEAGKVQDSVKYARRGLESAPTPWNMGNNKILVAPLPNGPTLMTDKHVAGLRIVAERACHEAKNAKEGYGHIRTISKALTETKIEHDKTVAQVAQDTCKQAQSQHQVAAVFEGLRMPYMSMTQNLTAARDQGNFAQEAIRNYDSYVAELVGVA
jgi:hypothetical protein